MSISRLVTVGAVLSAVHQGAEAVVPVLIGVTIDNAIATGASAALLLSLGVLAATFLVLAISFRFGARAGELAAERTAHRLRVELTARILDPRGGADRGRLPGALVNIATSDAERVGMVKLALALGIAAITGMLVGAVALLRLSLPLGLLVLLGTPLMLALAHALGRPLQRRSEVEQERAAHAAGVAADLVSGLRVLKGLGAERAAAQRYQARSRASLAATIHAAKAKSWHDGTLLMVNGLFLAIVALAGGQLVARGDISIGGLVAAVGLAQFLIGPLSVLAWANGELARGRASAKRVAQLLSTCPVAQPVKRGPQHPVTGRVRIRGAFHVDAGPGQIVAVVTADQASAHRLVQCLGREQEPDDDTVITLDGIPLTDLDHESARSAILVATHEAELFSGTVLDNITHAPADAVDNERLSLVLAAAGADEVVHGLPDGVHSWIDERGRSLSGGQRQRLALARALAADPPVLVLHEPTTAVDAVTELRIARGVRRLRQGRTTIVVTTSPALLAAADLVCFGSSAGTHAELMDSDAAYRNTVLV